MDLTTQYMGLRLRSPLVNLDGMRGMHSRRNIARPEEYQRANYIRILQGYEAHVQGAQ